MVSTIINYFYFLNLICVFVCFYNIVQLKMKQLKLSKKTILGTKYSNQKFNMR